MASRTEGLRLPYWAYICLVLPICFALLLDVTGDVPDVVMYTNQTVQLGDRAVLKCQFNGTPFSVSWKKGNDPTTATNLITWVDGKNDSGSCVHDETCEMNSDYSLIIKNVTIADQGLYICRVVNFKGNENHDSTDLTVYATLEEPYPFINECKEYEQNCTVFVQSPINITCTASRYFPDIDLMFLHGVLKVLTLDTVEWKNDDGTKSKLIITKATPSKIPYVCMAFNIPGSQDEHTSTISVFHHHANTTFDSGEPTETPSFKIVQPFGFFVVGVFILIMLFNIYLFFCKNCRNRENGNRDERMPILQTPRGENKDGNRDERMPILQTPRCENKVPDELMEPIQDETLRKFTDKLTGRHCKRLAMTLKITSQRIDEFILGNNHYVLDTRSLIAEWLREVECSNYEKRCRLDDAVIRIGRYDLQDFFKTLVDRPNAEQPRVKSYYFDNESIFDDDIPQLVKLVKWLQPDKKTQLKKKIGLRDENDDDDDTLKDQMKAWRNRITSTSSDNKVSRDQALKEFQSVRNELTNNKKYTELTLTDEEIEAVSSHLTSTDEQQKLTTRLHIDAVHGQNDSFVSQLKQWRNNQAKTCRDTLQKALKQMGLAEGIVSTKSRKQLDQKELPRISLNLMMEDVRPIINALGIDKEKVNTYVRQWNNQDKCTTGLLVNLKNKSRDRGDFCKALRTVGFIDIARSVYFDENVW